MNLYILRHAIAVERGSGGIGDDSLRPLTGGGKAKMRAIARGMRAMRLSFDLVLSSPYRRARDTAQIVVKEFGLDDSIELSPDLEPGGDPDRLMRRLAETRPGPSSVLLVGHEPYLSSLISMLLSGGSHDSITLKKGGLCKLTLGRVTYGRCATLEWLLTPRQLRGLAG
jgi:phosphohistidine phosphatase